MHDVAVLHHIVLAFDAHLTSLANGSFGAILDVVVVLDDLGTNETFLEVGVDDTSTLRSLPVRFSLGLPLPDFESVYPISPLLIIPILFSDCTKT